MHVFRELLDLEVHDRDDCRMGRVDALVAELRAGRPPRVVQLELGGVPMARRIHPRLEAWADRLHKKFGVRRSARFHIEWKDVLDLDIHRVKVDVHAAETPAQDWERWLRAHVIEKIPGSSQEEE